MFLAYIGLEILFTEKLTNGWDQYVISNILLDEVFYALY